MASAANCQPQRIPYSFSQATVEAISVWPKLGSWQFGSYWSRGQSKNRASHPGEGLARKWPPGRMSTPKIGRGTTSESRTVGNQRLMLHTIAKVSGE
jgi:hypothetical protein